MLSLILLFLSYLILVLLRPVILQFYLSDLPLLELDSYKIAKPKLLLGHPVVAQVRIFSAANVRQELQESLRDYIQATVGTNGKGKLLIPKLVQSYAKGAVEDSLLADWICHHLAPDQATVIRDSSSQWKQRLLGARSFTVLAFDSKFRYLFLPDSCGSQSQKPEAKQSYKLPEPCSESE
jgi:hypothetical protein